MTETRRLRLRAPEEKDFSAWLAMYTDETLLHDYGAKPFENVQEAADGWKNVMKSRRKIVIALKETDEMIGEINASDLNPWVREQESVKGLKGVSLSYAILPAFQRRGYAGEALTEIIRWLFREERCDFVNAGYFSYNAASRVLQEKLGFSYMGEHDFERAGERIHVIENILWRPGA